jgi:hypothetical protein
VIDGSAWVWSGLSGLSSAANDGVGIGLYTVLDNFSRPSLPLLATAGVVCDREALGRDGWTLIIPSSLYYIVHHPNPPISSLVR